MNRVSGRQAKSLRSVLARSLPAAAWCILAVGILVMATGCESKSHKKSKSSHATPLAVTPGLTVTLTRDGSATPNPILVTAAVGRASRAPAPGLALTVIATNGTAGAVTDHGDGTYSATVTPDELSGEVPIEVAVTVDGIGYQDQRTALILPVVDAGWEQPQAVRGAVNTPGYEDGPNISPDGQWLVVTDTSPVDAFCCIIGCGGLALPDRAASAYCQTVVAPDAYGPPRRPDFPGAWRVVSPTQVLNKCPKACFTSDYTAAGGENFDLPIPPIGSYIFKRQPDGSFGEPKFVGLNADGCMPPTGISFADAPDGAAGAVIFDWNDPNSPPESQIYWSPVTLGATNVLADCECTAPNVRTYTNVTAVPLALGYAQTRSNPSYRGGMLWWDDEDADPFPIYFSTASGTLPMAAFTPNAPAYAQVAVGTSGVDHSQPNFQASTNTLFFRSGDVGVSAATLTGTDPGNPAHWSAEQVILAGESTTRPGAITAVGQPTVAEPPGGKDELYFVYVMWTGTGSNFNIGMVSKR